MFDEWPTDLANVLRPHVPRRINAGLAGKNGLVPIPEEERDPVSEKSDEALIKIRMPEETQQSLSIDHESDRVTLCRANALSTQYFYPIDLPLPLVACAVLFECFR